MKLKMHDLVAQSGMSKSTILYYLKEGLLPPPEKPKPNLHLYPDETLQRLTFIKYFQEELGYSIAQIREIMHDSPINFKSSTETILTYLSALQRGLSATEFEELRTEAEKAGIDAELFEAYTNCARTLAKLEFEVGAKILSKSDHNSSDSAYRILFDTILKLKPYIFNQATIDEHRRRYSAGTKEAS